MLMNIFNSQPFGDIDSLIQSLKVLTSEEHTPSWKEVTPARLTNLISNNLRLIMAQTENQDTAPELKQSLIELSDRIAKEFNNPEGRTLSHEVQCYAEGILGKGAKPDLTDFPPELEIEIFSRLVPEQPQAGLTSGLVAVASVSKGWKE